MYVAQDTLTTALIIISEGQTSKNSDAARYANKDRLMIMSLIEQYYKRTCAGFWPYVINTEEDDDEDVLDGSQWHQTINIRPWQENVIGTNDAYFHTVAWYRAWGKIADVNELAACATRWKVPVPCSNVLWNLLLNESAEDILVMLCPPTRVRNTLPTRRSSRAHAWAVVRRHWLNELGTTRLCTTWHDKMSWARHDCAEHDWHDWHDKAGWPGHFLRVDSICGQAHSWFTKIVT